jgi:hypothetical protein
MTTPTRNSRPLSIDGVDYDVSNLSLQPNVKARAKDHTLQKPCRSEEFKSDTLIRSLYQQAHSSRPGMERTPSLYKQALSSRPGMERAPSLRKNQSPGRKKNERRGVERTPSFRKKKERMGMERSSSFRKKNERFGMERSQSFRAKHKIVVEKERFGLKKPPPSYSVHRQELPRAQNKSPEEEGPEGPCGDRKSQSESTPIPNPSSDVTVEIFPGVFETLRGSAETKLALQRGTITQVQCCCCAQDMQCIEDAAYFICPNCRVVGSVPRGIWGVGLGFVQPKSSNLSCAFEVNTSTSYDAECKH